MPIPRRTVVNRDEPGFYHCISRCVRRAYLCGGEYEHRRRWIQDRLHELADTFAIDVGGYAVMSNHLHLILWTDPRRAAAWSRTEVARRWVRLFPKSTGVIEPGEEALQRAIRRLAADPKRVELCRERLSDLSWFMRCLCEPIARRANREDDCTGRFWEGRFKCQALLDEAAVLACNVYVDLNMIRARLATLLERCEFTSVHDRIRVRQLFRKLRGRRRGVCREMPLLLPNLEEGRSPRHAEDGIWLAPIEDRSGRGRRGSGRSGGRRGMLGVTLDQYLQIVEATGRILRGDKKGAIPASLRPILERLDIDASRWAEAMGQVATLVGTAIGSAEALAREAARRGTKRVVGALDVYCTSVAG